MTEHSGETVCSFKRFMGTDKKYILGGSAYTPMELSAMVLERIRRNAEFALGEEIEEAIITVPAYFNDKQFRLFVRSLPLLGIRTNHGEDCRPSCGAAGQ
jgi:molecular chaperone HscC